METGIWNRNFLLLMAVSFCSGMIAQFISTAMMPYLTYGLLLGTATAGALSSIYTIVSSAGRLVAGNLVDRFSRKPFLFLGLVLFGIGCLGFGSTESLTLLVCFRVLQGLGFAVSSAASSAAAADVIPAWELGRGLGYMSMANALTQIIGPLLCTVLIGVGFYVLPFRVAAGICLLAVLIAVFTVDSFKKHKEQVTTEQSGSLLQQIFEKHALLPAGLQFLVSFSFSVYMVWGFNLAVEKGVGDITFGPLSFIGLFFAVGAAGMILIRFLDTRIVDRVNEYALCCPACILGAGSFLCCWGETTILRLMVGAVLYGTCLGVVQPALNTLSLKSVPANRRGAATATFMLGFDGGIGIGASVWGAVLAAADYDVLVLLAGGILTVSAALCIVLWRWSRKAAVKQ